MKRKNLLELELSIPNINLLDSRTLLGGMGYSEEPAWVVELPDVAVTANPEPEFDNQDHPDPLDDYDDYYNDYDQPPVGSQSEGRHMIDWKAESGNQIGFGCAFSSLLEIYNQQHSSAHILDELDNDRIVYGMMDTDDDNVWHAVAISGYEDRDG